MCGSVLPAVDSLYIVSSMLKVRLPFLLQLKIQYEWIVYSLYIVCTVLKVISDFMLSAIKEKLNGYIDSVSIVRRLLYRN